MWNRNAAVAAAVVTAVALLGACADSAPTEPGSGPDSQDFFRTGAVPANGFAGTLDAEFVRLAGELPGFGGLYLDADGALNVVMTGAAPMRTPAQVAATLQSRLSSLPIDAAALQTLRVREGRYDFIQLDAMHRAAAPVLALAGVVFTDADEVANRVRIGVESEAAAAAVRVAIQQAGVPLEAVVISETEPIQLNSNHTLRDMVRPVAGGLQINYIRQNPDGSVSGFNCTMGFNVRSPTAPGVHGFVTNSHCSDTRGVVIPTPYWQHSRFVEGTLIAQEAHDAPYWDGGICPAGRRCRYSDALGARYEPGIDNAFGGIYRTLAPGDPAGTLEIDPANPRWRIVAELPFPVVGQVLHKTGRTNGWTLGPVASTCANSNVANSDITMLCQDRVATTSAGGDSGSPYFERIGDTNDVRLIGIHWGSGGGTTVMSAMNNIRYENEGPTGWITYPGQTPPPAAPR